MKYYTIILLLVAISILLYFGYKLNDIPKTILNTKSTTNILNEDIHSNDIHSNDMHNKGLQILSKSNVFLDIMIGSKNMGQIVIELFDEDVPLTCNNFRHLCTTGIKNKTIPAYKNTKFNCIIKNFMIQGGDIINNNGTSGYSIYGKYFKDENFKLKHNQEGLVSMASCGKDKNNSQFFILTKQNGCVQLDTRYVVFGIIISGYDIIKKIENTPVSLDNTPLEDCIISNCGMVKEKEDYTVCEEIVNDSIISSSQQIKISI